MSYTLRGLLEQRIKFRDEIVLKKKYYDNRVDERKSIIIDKMESTNR